MKIALGTVQLGLAHGIANQDGQVSREEAKTLSCVSNVSLVFMLL